VTAASSVRFAISQLLKRNLEDTEENATTPNWFRVFDLQICTKTIPSPFLKHPILVHSVHATESVKKTKDEVTRRIFNS